MRYRITHLPPDFVRLPALRSRRRPGKPYVADVVEEVRALVEGTSLSTGAIAFQVGIGVGTVHAWIVRRQWRRPIQAAPSTRSVRPDRASFTRRLRVACERVRHLAEREAVRLEAAMPPDRPALARAAALADAARQATEAAGAAARPRPRKAAADAT